MSAIAAGALGPEELASRRARQAEWEGQAQEAAEAWGKLFTEGAAAAGQGDAAAEQRRAGAAGQQPGAAAAAPAGVFAALLSGSRRQGAQAAGGRGRGRGRGAAAGGGASSTRGTRQGAQQLPFNEYMALIAAVRGQ